jgi:hypothetical protein
MHDLYNLTREGLLDYIASIGGAIVVSRPVGGIGDGVMILPAVTGLKAEYGDVPLVVLCVDYIEPIFRHHPGVDAVISFTKNEIDNGFDRKCLLDLADTGSVIYPLYYPCPASEYESDVCPDINRSRQEIFAESCDVKFEGGGYNIILSEEEINIPNVFGIGSRYIAFHLRSHDRWRDYPSILVKALLSKLVKFGKKYDIEIEHYGYRSWSYDAYRPRFVNGAYCWRARRKS